MVGYRLCALSLSTNNPADMLGNAEVLLEDGDVIVVITTCNSCVRLGLLYM
jgi:hypothetical protein